MACIEIYRKIYISLTIIENDTEIVWPFKRIADHEGPLSRTHHQYIGSQYNVRIEWENGEIMSELVYTIAKDGPVTCVIYTKENNLLDTPGWK